MLRTHRRQLLTFAAGLVALFLPACGGGDGEEAVIIVTLQNVTPNSSATLNGGELVIVRGTNFDRANVINVLFGGQNVNSFDVLDNERIEVRTPRAPGNLPNTVGVEVFSERAVTAILQNAYTYTAPDLPPVPTTIFPTTFTATGAETFTIQGTNLGPVSGTVNVIFVGAGTVVANVNANATIISGRAPITNMPPAGNVTVTVDKGTTTGDVPTSVSYSYGAPTILGATGQAADGASRPVNLGSGSAVLCTAGGNTVWGDADDEVLIVRGPPPPPHPRSFPCAAPAAPPSVISTRSTRCPPCWTQTPSASTAWARTGPRPTRRTASCR